MCGCLGVCAGSLAVFHRCNNGTKWGLKVFAPEQRIVEDAHICTRSLRNCASAFHSHIDRFLIRYLEFVPFRSASEDDARAFWVALGVDPEVAAQLAETDLHWDGARLRVHADFQLQQGALSRLHTMVLHLMRWMDFSDTRWIGSGSSGRLFMAALAGGMDGIHEVMRADPHCSRENMAGIARATPEVRMFLAGAAFSAYSTERLGLELLEDDRFLRRADELWQLMQDELLYLHDLPNLVWERTAALISTDTCPLRLRDSCLVAAHIGSAYLWDDSFEQLARSPLNITQGDVAANIAAIGAGSWDPLDGQSNMIRTCLEVGVPAADLVRLFELVRDGPSTINIVEQGHASHAVVLQQHQQLQERHLRARSTIHQCRTLLRRDRCLTKVERLEAALNQLDRRQPQRDAFRAFSTLFTDEQVAAALGDHRPPPWSPEERLRARRRLFQCLPAPELRAVHRFARVHAAARRQQLQEERARLLDELAAARASAAAECLDCGLRNRVSDCDFSRADMQGLLHMYNIFGPNDQARVEKQPFEPLAVPDQDVRLAIEEHFLDEGSEQMPWWAMRIASHRDIFRGTADGCTQANALRWKPPHAKGSNGTRGPFPHQGWF